MPRNLPSILTLFILCATLLILTVQTGQAQRSEARTSTKIASGVSSEALITALDLNPALPTDCAMQPEPRNTGGLRRSPRRPEIAVGSVTLERFRQSQPEGSQQSAATGQRSTPTYTPQEEIVLIDSTNYGDRFLRDINGQPANQQPIVVLHETVASTSSTIGFFRTRHPQDDDQASYHTLIDQQGTVIYLVPPDKRAFGAGNSAFNGAQGLETVRTHPSFPASVNNFAYHVSLETPPDGINSALGHSGYTEAQYQSLAWLVAKTGVADDRITTHRAVDRSGSRIDPRSFQFSRFLRLLQTYPKTNEIPLRCTVSPDAM